MSQVRVHNFSISLDGFGTGDGITFEAPFVRILALYSNTLEDPGVISSEDGKYSGVPDVQLEYLSAAVDRVKRENFKGALLLCVHHPPYALGKHSGSMVMLKEIDAICKESGVWPHAILSGHSHNYQRFTRTRPDGTQIPYVSCGNGGHNVQTLARKGNPPLRTPQVLQSAQRGAAYRRRRKGARSCRKSGICVSGAT